MPGKVKLWRRVTHPRSFRSQARVIITRSECPLVAEKQTSKPETATSTFDPQQTSLARFCYDAQHPLFDDVVKRHDAKAV